MVFWGAESTSDVFKVIGVQGQVSRMKVKIILLNKTTYKSYIFMFDTLMFKHFASIFQ